MIAVETNEVYARLEKVFEDVFDEKIPLNPDLSAKDVEDWDSLSHITLIAATEDEFGLKFKMKEVSSMKNVGEMVSIIAERGTK